MYASFQGRCEHCGHDHSVSHPAAEREGEAMAALRRLIPLAQHGADCSVGLNEACDCALGDAQELTRDSATPAPQPDAPVEVSAAARDVLAERQRQDSAEGYHAKHDDDHESGEMANAAAYYAMTDGTREYLRREHITERSIMPPGWKFKPKDRRRDLVRAGALVLAEIERIDRAAALECQRGSP